MGYSTSFIQKVKECYPDSPKMHDLADNGEYFLGRYLDDSSSGAINVDAILLATSLDELQKVARREKMRVNLYKEWWDEVRDWPRK